MSHASPSSEALLARLLDLHPKLIDLSLGRMTRLLAALGNPQDKAPPIVHIAGTNGKGSTLAFTRAILHAAGHQIHCYTSPHLVEFHERITLAGQPISEPQLADYLRRCEVANQGQDITFFEITTAAAFLAFAEHPADFLLLEVGLGGRLDATNVIDPLLSVITPVSHDHEDFLGADLAGIAAEKAGIIKAERPVISAPQDSVVADVIEKTANLVNAPLARGGQDWQVGREHGRLVFQDQTGLLDLPEPNLVGFHQITNAGTAIAIARALHIEPEAIAAGLQNAEWPARLQHLPDGRLTARVRQRLPQAEVWLDGGHNQAAAQMLATWLQSQTSNRPLHMIIGLLASKAHDDFLAAFAARPELSARLIVHCVPISGNDNALPPQLLHQAARAQALHSFAHADLSSALNAIEAPDALILIAGSLYLAGEVLKANRKTA